MVGAMKTKLFSWLGREFVEVVGEGAPGAPPDRAADELFRNFESELKRYSLSLEHTARIRVWGKDRDGRALATATRAKILTGKRKAASSSFISGEWFDSGATAGLELLALHPRSATALRNPVDFEPARNYLCYLDYDGLLFFSGFTSEAATLEQQAKDVLGAIGNALGRAGADWAQVKKLSCLVQRGHPMESVRQAIDQAGLQKIFEVDFTFVDGFAGEKYLLEIEATAVRP
jgi:enamine deaminase RidA (YjgF/YER057c/UK114 family)